jgi:hypothetical protein
MQKEEREKQDFLWKNFRLWRASNLKSHCLRKFGREKQGGNVGKKTVLWDYWREKGYVKSGEKDKVEKRIERENVFEEKITKGKEEEKRTVDLKRRSGKISLGT